MVRTRDIHIKMTPSSSWDERLITGSEKIIVALKKHVTPPYAVFTRIHSLELAGEEEELQV